MVKSYIFLLLLACSLTGGAQTFFGGAPGFMTAPGFYDHSGNAIEYNSIQQKFKVRVGFQNASFSFKIPNNTIRLEINLGDKLMIDSTGNFKLSKAPLNQYFTWAVENVSGRQVIVGTQKTGSKADIPAGFTGVFEFDVIPSATGESAVEASITVVNQNSTEKTTDPAEADNVSNVNYKVIRAVVAGMKEA